MNPVLFSVNFASITSMVGDIIKYLGDSLGGYGWALIAIGVITRLVMSPFYSAQMKQMKKMEKIRPLMEKLQQKYKDNEQELAKRTMELFRQQKVNPFTGCLLMLVQLPILIVIYRAIYANLSMFEGQKFLWITDLAKPDLLLFGVYILSMYLSMELTPTPSISNEERHRMKRSNLLMILLFAVILYKLASAFILYWLAYNLASLAHTLIIMGFEEQETAENRRMVT